LLLAASTSGNTTRWRAPSSRPAAHDSAIVAESLASRQPAPHWAFSWLGEAVVPRLAATGEFVPAESVIKMNIRCCSQRRLAVRHAHYFWTLAGAAALAAGDCATDADQLARVSGNVGSEA